MNFRYTYWAKKNILKGKSCIKIGISLNTNVSEGLNNISSYPFLLKKRI